MSDGDLRSLRFRREREVTWRLLETILERVEKNSVNSLSRDELLEAPALYRATLSSLSVARATSLDQALITYLESLCTRAYFFVYGPRTTLLAQASSFFARDWPAAVRAQVWPTFSAALILIVAGVCAFLLVQTDPAYFYSFVPADLAGERQPGASAEALRATLYQDVDAREALGVFAAFLFNNNATVALLAFALGIALCVPSVALIAMNGCTIGAMIAVFASQGLTREFAAWLSVHGVTEILAIVLAGGAGLKIGWAAAFPGGQTRLEAVEAAGRQGGVVMIGVILMLAAASLLEGFARQLVQDEAARWGIAAFTAVAWGVYFYGFSGGAARAQAAGLRP